MGKYFHCLPVLLFIKYFTSFQVFLTDFSEHSHINLLGGPRVRKLLLGPLYSLSYYCLEVCTM